MTITERHRKQVEEAFTDICMIAEAEMGCAMSLSSMAKIKKIVDHFDREVRVDEAKWFRGTMEYDWSWDQIRKYQDEHIAALEGQKGTKL